MNRWDTEAIEYTDVEAVREALIGRSIVSTLSEGADYERVLSFVLDDGTVLKAHATDGGCGCSNGCFTVQPGNVIRGTILNVEVSEVVEHYDYQKGESVTEEVTPGSISDGSAVIRLFVYTDLNDKALLVESEGGDNGYYGWGFWLSVHSPQGTLTKD